MADGRLIFTGTVVVDLLLTVDALPEHGGDVLASSVGMTAGGGFNVMAAAARDGAEVVFAGRSGTGPFGEVVAEALWREGISVANPPLETVDNGYCVVLVDAGAERTFVTAPGAEGMLSRADLDAVQPHPGDVVYASGYSLAHPGSGAHPGFSRQSRRYDRRGRRLRRRPGRGPHAWRPAHGCRPPSRCRRGHRRHPEGTGDRTDGRRDRRPAGRGLTPGSHWSHAADDGANEPRRHPCSS